MLQKNAAQVGERGETQEEGSGKRSAHKARESQHKHLLPAKVRAWMEQAAGLAAAVRSTWIRTLIREGNSVHTVCS